MSPTRRELLAVGGLTPVGLGLSKLLAEDAGPAKHGWPSGTGMDPDKPGENRPDSIGRSDEQHRAMKATMAMMMMTTTGREIEVLSE